MGIRFAGVSALALIATLASAASAQTIAGSRQAEVGARDIVKVENYKAPRNAMGQPDLQGLWTNASLTTLERPTQFGDRLVLTTEEAAKIEGADAAEKEANNAPTNPDFKVTDLPVNCGGGFTGVNCGYNNFWVDPGKHVMNVNGEFRSSFLVEPKNGKLPGLTPEAQKARTARLSAVARPTGPGMGRGDNPESMTLAERCIKDFGSSSGPPMMPLLYNNTYQIVQAPDHALILIEMVHDARIIPLVDPKAPRHRPEAIKQWMGDSVGWYEGDTLVVETTNFRPGQGFRGLPDNGKLIERFRRVNDKQVLYTFEINDLATFTAPIKAEVSMNATPGPLYEYACHEGNYALPGILGGNRKTEWDREMAAAKANATKPKGGQ